MGLAGLRTRPAADIGLDGFDAGLLTFNANAEPMPNACFHSPRTQLVKRDQRIIYCRVVASGTKRLLDLFGHR